MLELKSHFDGDLRLAQRAADVLANYRGPVAVMSFDPALIEAVRAIAPLCRAASSPNAITRITNGTAFRRRKSAAWRIFLHATRTRPQFIAYAVKDLPAAAPLIARTIFGLPLLTWTVRSEADRGARGALGRPDHLRGHPALPWPPQANDRVNFDRFPA